ncbi:MAG: HEAT repeat domain-containing protein [Spirochaetia bacterium]|nr:HEAT repeat domain-containing protein [Spirochaetia bacterium]
MKHQYVKKIMLGILILFLPIAALPEKKKPDVADRIQDTKKAEKRKKYLNSLKDAIRYQNSTERRQAIGNIKSLEKKEQDEFIPLLKKFAVDDLDYFVRESSVRTLGELDRRDAEDVFIQALKDSKTDVKRAAVRALSRIETKDLKPVFEMVQKEDFSEYSNLMTASIRLLGKKKYKDAKDFFKQKADHPETNLETRKTIILFFGNAEVSAMKNYLLEMAKDESEDLTIREYAVNSLGKLNDKSVIPDLKSMYDKIRTLRNKQERSQFSRLKLQLITAMIRLGDETAIPEILSAAKDDDPNVRVKAIRQIGEMKLESARELLEYKAKYDMSKLVKKESKAALNLLDGKKSDEPDDDTEEE